MEHPFEPIYNNVSQILILGSFPSVKSRAAEFYYHHPQNRFWKVISALTDAPEPKTIAAKKALLLEQRIAVWDVIYSCDIVGSSDASIKNVVPNDIAKLLNKTSIKTVYANGGKAAELYNRYCYQQTNKKIIKLPSTSPANARYSLEKLIECWSQAMIRA
ncbi:DNA-deoxyinosine glycosylase [Acetobacterium woodii]|uniref:Uracil-DNA glycosylase-like domain-containing protein n=1 Tax=Acetobacterium woodii (strain ATCC 29683 / DSM 1030 / JCM 2381 / KCTC 1655 / WB1) TaxID=931626 RepID=H6LER9_ACEWD|nr:DNA-deoxyinosine glycosylase [Acetobacterium woodii]AFA49362.1 hypothetical protein Awo_c26060 [Acetobacterium woodii DSM 1030]